MWFFGMIGILTATTGLWLSAAPENSEAVPDLRHVGHVRCVAVARTHAAAGRRRRACYSDVERRAGRDYHFQAAWWMVLLQAVLGLVGVAAAILGALALLDRADIYTNPSLPI